MYTRSYQVYLQSCFILKMLMSSLPDLRCGTGRSVANAKLFRTSYAVHEQNNIFAFSFRVGIISSKVNK